MASSSNESSQSLGGLEIQPYVPSQESNDEAPPQNLESPKPEEMEDVPNHGGLVAVPISFRLPEDITNASETNSATGMRGAPRSVTVSMSSPMKLEIPEDSVSDISQMAGPSEASTMDTQTISQLTLSELQEGWLVEKRKRLNGRIDKFYYHEKSNKMFQSFAEVEKGQYPQRKQHSEDQKPQDQSTSAFQPLGSEVSPNVSLKRKTKTSSFDGCSTIPKGNDFSTSSSSSKQPMETIAELLAGAYNNLLKFFSEKKDTKSSILKIICEEQDDQMIQNMIEELLDERNNFSLIDEEPMAPRVVLNALQKIKKRKECPSEGRGKSCEGLHEIILKFLYENSIWEKD